MGQLFDSNAWLAMAPMIALSAGVLLLLLIDVIAGAQPGILRARNPIVVACIVAAAAFEIRALGTTSATVLEGTLATGGTIPLWGLLILASLLVSWITAQGYYREEEKFLIEHDCLMLSSTVGMMLMAGAQDLLVFFVGLELLSVPLYALASFQRSRSTSVEAGMKYFVLGAFASGIFLYGAALVYTGTGTISLASLREVGAGSPLALAGVALLAGSLFFKVSVFPFHLWVPDVYQGSPTPVTTLMATGTKTAGFAFLLSASFLLPREALGIVVVIALATMAAGNLGALVQTDIKRMLAWSGIAHAGTVLLGIAGGLAGDPGERRRGRDDLLPGRLRLHRRRRLRDRREARVGDRTPVTIESLRGLAKERPGVAAAMAAFMLSLGGIPATGGFLGKYLVFSVAVRAGLVAAAVVGVLLSVVALGYYLRVIVAMYMQPSAGEQPAAARKPWPSLFAATACAAVVLALGILPGWLLERL